MSKGTLVWIMEEILVTWYLVLYHDTFTAEFEDASFGLPVQATVFSNIFLMNISNSPELSKNPRSLKNIHYYGLSCLWSGLFTYHVRLRTLKINSAEVILTNKTKLLYGSSKIYRSKFCLLITNQTPLCSSYLSNLSCKLPNDLSMIYIVLID